MQRNFSPDERAFILSPWLSGLSSKTKGEILRDSHLLFIDKGKTLFEVGDAADSLYLIVYGSIKLSIYDAEGREKIVGIFEEGEAIWESVFLGDSFFPFSAFALNEARVYQIPQKSYAKAITSAETASRVIALLSQKLHDANQRNLILAKTNAKSRVAGFLLYRAERSPKKIFSLRLEEIAASVSLRVETVSRKLGELLDEGYIRKIGQSGFEIIDFAALKEMSDI